MQLLNSFFFQFFSDNPLYCSCKLFQWITQDFVSKNCHNHLKGQNPKKNINCIGKNNQTKHNILEKDFCPTHIQVSFFSLKKNYKIAKIYNNMLGQIRVRLGWVGLSWVRVRVGLGQVKLDYIFSLKLLQELQVDNFDIRFFLM